MICPYCSKSIPDESKFCTKCGRAIPRCPTCNRAITHKTNFCPIDGTKINEELLRDLPLYHKRSDVPEKKEISVHGAKAVHPCKKCGKPCDRNKNLCSKCNQQKKRLLFVIIGCIILLITLVGIVIAKKILSENNSLVASQGDSLIQDDDLTEEDGLDLADEEVEVDSEFTDESIIEESEPILPEVPDFIGYNYEYAKESFNSLGVPVEVQYEFSDSYNRGSIIKTDWIDNKTLLVTLSKGLASTYYDMYKLNSRGELEYIDIYYVDEQGQHTIAYKTDSNHNEIYHFTFEYDDYGRELAQYFYEPDGTAHHYWKFEYNATGQIVAEYKYNSADEETDRYEYSYNSTGQMTTRKEYQNGQLTYTWEITQYDNDSSPAAYSPHLFGAWTFADIYNAEGTHVRYATQRFDQNGSIEAFSVYNDDNSIAYQYMFDNAQYDEINTYSDSLR